jgi:hypothetical protein
MLKMPLRRLRGYEASHVLCLLTPMITSAFKRLDLVSKVTIRIFLGQLAFAAVMAAPSPKGFIPTFTVTLLFFAIIQSALALMAARRPPAGTLSEWDGVSWLLLVAMGCYLLSR